MMNNDDKNDNKNDNHNDNNDDNNNPYYDKNRLNCCTQTQVSAQTFVSSSSVLRFLRYDILDKFMS